MTNISDAWAEQYRRSHCQRPLAPTWWVRFNKGTATGPFSCQEAALRFLDAELIKMGHHGGCHVVGSFSGERLEFYQNEETREVGRDPNLGATLEENLVATWSDGTAQIFKKVPKKKR